MAAKTSARVPRGRRGPTFIQRSRSVASEEKAMYHTILGAGRRGVIRDFFTLGTDDEEVIGMALERLIATRLGRQGA